MGDSRAVVVDRGRPGRICGRDVRGPADTHLTLPIAPQRVPFLSPLKGGEGIIRLRCRQPGGEFGTQARDRLRQLVAAARRLAEPERDVGRLALGVLDPERAALDAAY